MIKIKRLLLVLSIFGTFTAHADVVNKNEDKALKKFLDCLAVETQDVESMGKCTKPFFSKDLSQSQKKRLLGWFLLNQKITTVECDSKSLVRAQKKYVGPEIRYVCAIEGLTAGQASRDSGYVFVFTAVENQDPKLLNLIEKR